MSDRYGFDFNNDGEISFEESHLTITLSVRLPETAVFTMPTKRVLV